MTYFVLARKWRPQSFDTLVGQDHVVRALTHALDSQRLHHAWLFTGTRGVGKTTLSRILAKSLNCATGITAKPCNQCGPCTEIDAGCFVDYLELDAASNRGVDEMTHLLEQATYMPGVGRFKVYMIDEVHMLTGHAFNAMLKTLEEPPPHVKFILATTDPQKIPVTVLSRCLQFNLKQMPVEAIVGHLQPILRAEQQTFEVSALRLLAQAAAGSMRDALSLTDQAIAYCAGALTEASVRDMLGTVDQRYLVRLLDALAVGDARAVLALADELAMRGLSYRGALADFAVLLSRVAIEQRIVGVTSDEDNLAADIARLAQCLHPDAVQLFYSIAVHSRGELSLAPDEYAGFVMTCLRMIALNGEAASGEMTSRGGVPGETTSGKIIPGEAVIPRKAALGETISEKTVPEERVSALPPTQSAVPGPGQSERDTNAPLSASITTESTTHDQNLSNVPLNQMSAALWPQLVARLPLTGLAAELARQSEWVNEKASTITLRVAVKTLADSTSRARLQTALCTYFGQNLRLTIEVGETGAVTAHVMAQQARAARQQAAEAAVTADPFVQSLVSSFDGHVIPGSISHVEPPTS